MSICSTTGKGLNVLMLCDYCPHHNWMVFSSWYSFSKNLPDAKFFIDCSRAVLLDGLFDWVGRIGLRYRLNNPTSYENRVQRTLDKVGEPLLVINPNILAIRELEGDFNTKSNVKQGEVWWIGDKNSEVKNVENLYFSCKEENFSTFISYEHGWGKFVTSSWINKTGYPFSGLYGEFQMTSNEVKIERLWKQLSPLFTTVSDKGLK